MNTRTPTRAKKHTFMFGSLRVVVVDRGVNTFSGISSRNYDVLVTRGTDSYSSGISQNDPRERFTTKEDFKRGAAMVLTWMLDCMKNLETWKDEMRARISTSGEREVVESIIRQQSAQLSRFSMADIKNALRDA